MTRAQIERLGEEGGGLGSQEVGDLLALHDAYARTTTWRRVTGYLMMGCVAVLLYLVCSELVLVDRWASTLIKASSIVVSIAAWKFLFDVVRDRRRAGAETLVAPGSLAAPGHLPLTDLRSRRHRAIVLSALSEIAISAGVSAESVREWNLSVGESGASWENLARLALMIHGQAPDGMRDNYDFSGVSRGKFFCHGARVILPTHAADREKIHEFDAGPLIPGIPGDRVLRQLLRRIGVGLDSFDQHTLLLRRQIDLDLMHNVEVPLARAPRAASAAVLDAVADDNSRRVSEAIVEIAMVTPGVGFVVPACERCNDRPSSCVVSRDGFRDARLDRGQADVVVCGECLHHEDDRRGPLDARRWRRLGAPSPSEDRGVTEDRGVIKEGTTT